MESPSSRSSPKSLRREAVEFGTAATYFTYWNWKTPLRNSLHLGSLRVLQGFTILLVIEVIHELWKDQTLSWVVAEIHLYRRAGLIVFFTAALLLFWHHNHETKKPEYEYKFIKRLYELIERSRVGGTPAPIVDVLKILHSAFKRADIHHVSLHLPGEDGVLRISPDHVFPQESNPRYFVELAKGEGLAGRVFADYKPRYVPRLFFPNWRLRAVPFQHCVRVAFREREKGRFRRAWESVKAKFGGKSTALEPDLVPDSFDMRVFWNDSRIFRSILSVPLRSMEDGGCVGVLNLDFDATDPLDKGGITVAIVFGVLLGDVIKRKGFKSVVIAPAVPIVSGPKV